VFSLDVIRQYTLLIMYSDCDIGLSELLYFWPYVWKLDPKHTYDKHPILA
jgi:hypothetical protein